MSRGIIEEFREGSSSRLKRTFVSGEVMLNMNQLSEDGVYFLSETDAGSTNFFLSTSSVFVDSRIQMFFLQIFILNLTDFFQIRIQRHV